MAGIDHNAGAPSPARNAFLEEVVRHIYGGHKHVLISVLYNVAQTMLLVGAFYLFAVLFHMNANMIRGDLLIFLITGVFIFGLHVKSVGAILDVKPGRSFVAGALGCLYTQIYSIAIVVGLYALCVNPVKLYHLPGVGAGMLLSWLSGIGVGLVFRAIKLRSKPLAGLIAQAYSRINMFGSGQMFVANMLPAYVLSFFKWNPLFHIVDQTRGAAFLNYTPWYSNWLFPSLATMGVLMFGMLIDARTRSAERHAPDALTRRPA